MVVLLLYVDDFLMVASNTESFKRLKEVLMERFAIKDTGNASLILRMQITQDRAEDKLRRSQEKFVKSVREVWNVRLNPRVHARVGAIGDSAR